MRPVVVPDATIVHAVGGSTSSSGRKMCMVMAGKATVLHTGWKPLSRGIGLALLQAGALVRRRNPTWAEVWRCRRDWRAGYPDAKAPLFTGDASPSYTTHDAASVSRP
jgi:hypothetical protein